MKAKQGPPFEGPKPEALGGDPISNRVAIFDCTLGRLLLVAIFDCTPGLLLGGGGGGQHNGGKAQKARAPGCTENAQIKGHRKMGVWPPLKHIISSSLVGCLPCLLAERHSACG
jgi:hypothetical protein